MTDEPKRELKPAEENFWYKIATLGNSILTDSTLIRMNRTLPQNVTKNAYLWNMLMRIASAEEIIHGREKHLVQHSKPDLQDKYQDVWQQKGDHLTIEETRRMLHEDIFGDTQFLQIINDLNLHIEQNSTIDISSHLFKGGITNFSDFIFPFPFNIENSHLNAEHNSTRNSILAAIHDLDGGKIHGAISFRNAIFLDKTNFSQVTFDSMVLFENATFTLDVNFENSKFNKGASFQEALFKESAQFTETNFQQNAYFYKAIFEEDANFQDSHFQNNAIFHETTFKGHSDFTNTIFSKMVSFQKTEWKFRALFTRCQFEECPPAFFKAEIHPDTDWRKIILPKRILETKENTYASHANIYENLARHMEDIGRGHDRHFFYRYEMQAREKTGELSWFGNKISRIYGGLWDYGHGIGKAASWWGGNILLGWLVLFCTLIFKVDESIGSAIGKALVHSFANAHAFLGLRRTFLGGDTTLNLFNAIGYVQAVFGVIFLFFLLLTLRNRFRIG